ncbi:MAG: LysR family transcriptional regulator, partial [Clostridia bacterium]|nr:LysR family transcriptional regulator [Clostridia bacterium]
MLDNRVYTLLKVNECGSFVAAARELNVTQPAVSQHIKALEEELNVTIFVRGKGKLVLTKEGGEI